MIRASDLVGSELRTESGERLGRVHDLRAERRNGEWCLSGLVLGRRGLSARLLGTGPDPLISGEVVDWEDVRGLEDGLVVVSDGSHAARGRRRSANTCS